MSLEETGRGELKLELVNTYLVLHICFMTGLGHFNNESSFKVVEGALKDVNVKEVATSGDSCLALSGILIYFFFRSSEVD